MAFVDVSASLGLADAATGTKIALYRRQEYAAGWTKLGVYEASSVTISDLVVGVEYEIAAALVDPDGVVAPETKWAIATIRPKGTDGQTVPPVTNLTVVQDEEFLDLEWDDVSAKMRFFGQYEVRRGSSWSDSIRIGYESTSAKMRIKWQTSGAQTYRIVTLDEYGKRSAEATFAITVRALAGFVTGTTVNEDGGGFAGTKTDTEVDSGDLVQSVWGSPANTATEQGDTATWLPWGKYEGTYESAETDLGSARNVRIECDLTAVKDITAQTADEINLPPNPPDQQADGTAIDLTDESAVVVWGDQIAAGDERPNEVVLEIKADTSTPIATSYQRYVPGFYYGRYVRWRVRVRSWDRHRRVKLDTLRWVERKKNLKDEGSVSVAGAGPTAETFVQPFISEPYVIATHSTSTNRVVLSSMSAAGFSVTVYDPDDVEVTTGSVYWVAAGA